MAAEAAEQTAHDTQKVLHKSSIMQMNTRVSRQLSSLIDSQVIAHIGTKYSTSAAVVYALNMTLGTGPLTLPYAFAQAGLLLGGAFLGICSVLGYITATYVIETLVLANTADFEGAEDRLIQEEDIVADADDSPIDKTDADLVGLREKMRRDRSDKVFRIRERMELGGLGRRFLPSGVWQLVYACLFLYTFGCLCVYSVALTTSIEGLLPCGETVEMPGGTVVRTHSLVVLLLAVVIFPLCFADMQKLRSLQWIIMAVRVLALMAMLLGAFALAKPGDDKLPDAVVDGAGHVRDGAWVWQGMPLVDPDGLPSLFANAVLAFMVHHSLPGLLAPLEDQGQSPKVIRTAYSLAYLIYLILGGTALMAFGAAVPQLYNMAFASLPIPVVPQLLCGYPLLILAIYPIVSITFRNNMLDVLGLPPPSSDGPVQLKDVISTALAALPPVGVAFMTSDVQAIVGVFAGYFGLTLFLLVPCALMRSARRKLDVVNPDFTYKHRSPWGHPAMVSIVVLAYLGAIIFNTYRLFFI